MYRGRKPNVQLKMRMFEKGIRQKELAQSLGMSVGKMSHIVTGLTAPDVYEGQKIARELSTTVEELWPLDEKP